MIYTPLGEELFCEYCRYTPQVQDAKDDVNEQDFIVGMATTPGHSFAVSKKAFDCKACGAVYLLPPEMLSLTYAHCESSCTIDAITERKLIPPVGIIPFVTTRSQAEVSLLDNVSKETKNSSIRLESMQGIYLPVWTFDVRGEVP